jgi:cytochrome c biogenesis protein CcmG/thiol:disulfide interchange protein DsbE
VAVSFIGVLAFGFTRNPADLPSALLDLEAPDFELPVMPPEEVPGAEAQLAETPVIRLASLRGSPVILNFWASWCLSCRAEHPALSAAAVRYRDHGVRFFGVLYQDTPENGRRFIEEMGGQTYPSLLDPGSRTAIEYGVYGVPETFFIGRDGIIKHKHLGPVTPALLDARIGELLAAEETSNEASDSPSP